MGACNSFIECNKDFKSTTYKAPQEICIVALIVFKINKNQF